MDLRETPLSHSIVFCVVWLGAGIVHIESKNITLAHNMILYGVWVGLGIARIEIMISTFSSMPAQFGFEVVQ
jgi:hypothetical protein